MGEIEVIFLNESNLLNLHIDGQVFGPGKHVLTYYNVIKYRFNHDFLVLTVKDKDGVRRVYVPAYMILRITWIRRLFKCY